MEKQHINVIIVKAKDMFKGSSIVLEKKPCSLLKQKSRKKKVTLDRSFSVNMVYKSY